MRVNKHVSPDVLSARGGIFSAGRIDHMFKLLPETPNMLPWVFFHPRAEPCPHRPKPHDVTQSGRQVLCPDVLTSGAGIFAGHIDYTFDLCVHEACASCRDLALVIVMGLSLETDNDDICLLGD